MIEAITIRRSTVADRSLIVRLAALDDRPVPRGDVMLAFVEGELGAAVPLGGGEPVADPFRPTEHLVALLRLRAAQEREERNVPRGPSRGNRTRGARVRAVEATA